MCRALFFNPKSRVLGIHLVLAFSLLGHAQTSEYAPVFQRAHSYLRNYEKPRLSKGYLRSSWDGRLAVYNDGFRAISYTGYDQASNEFQWKESALAKLTVCKPTTVYGKSACDYKLVDTKAGPTNTNDLTGLATGVSANIGPDPDAIGPNPSVTVEGNRTTRNYKILTVFNIAKDGFRNPESIGKLTGGCVGYWDPEAPVETRCKKWGSDHFIGKIKMNVQVVEVAEVDGTTTAQVEYVRIDKPAELLSYKDTNNIIRPVQGIEPASTFDGRLVVYKARVATKTKPEGVLYTHALAYVYMGRDYYTQPRSVAWSPAWIKAKYPLFRKPLLNPDGTDARFYISKAKISDPVINWSKDYSDVDWSQGIIGGAYTWISPDGSDLYFTALPSGDTCNMRAGYAVVGASTNYTLRLIDGAMNWTRGMYGLSYCNAKTIPGTTVKLGYAKPNKDVGFVDSDDSSADVRISSYDTRKAYAFLAKDRLPGHDFRIGDKEIAYSPSYWPAFYKQTFDAPVMRGTAWDPLAFSNPDTRSLPRSRAKRTDVLFAGLSGSGVQGEVSYDDSLDGSYGFYWHMNEMMTALASNPTTPGHSARSLDLRSTPDTSGNFLTGALGAGAYFSQDRHFIEKRLDAKAKFPAWGASQASTEADEYVGGSKDDAESIIQEDYQEGRIGQSVHMMSNGCVALKQPNDDVLKSIEKRIATRGLTLEAWVKFEGPSVRLNIFDIPEVISVRKVPSSVSPHGYLVASIPRRNDMILKIPFSADGWNHVAVRVTNGAVSLHLNDQFTSLSFKNPTTGLAAKAVNFRKIRVGPCGTENGNNAFVMAIDEVAASTISRAPSALLTSADRSKDHFLTNPSSARAVLGEILFNDARLSKDGRVSCASCHALGKGFFASGESMPAGVTLSRTIPSVELAGFSPFLMADGGATSLGGQVGMPLLNRAEHGMVNFDAIVSTLKKLGYQDQFKSAFAKKEDSPDTSFITEVNIRDALASYIRRLSTRASLQIDGKDTLLVDMAELPVEKLYLTSNVKAGFEVFRGKGRCVACHAGPLLTDNGFHDTGVADNVDLGRYAITGSPRDMGRFRTPSLWNTSLKAGDFKRDDNFIGRGYFHNGKLSSLEEVVNFYNNGGELSASTQGDRMSELVPLNLTNSEKLALVEFLKALKLNPPDIKTE